jgi:hypothetical protein
LELITGERPRYAEDAGAGFTTTFYIWMSINRKRQKAENLQRNPSCTAFFMDPDNPYRTVDIRGQVDIAPDTDYAFADKVGARYGASLREMDSEGETRMIFTPKADKVITYG